MNKGFIFNHNKCVSCNACSAACIIENGWTVRPRKIYTYNSEAEAGVPLINLSLACNHCEAPACMDGCPAGSYSREVGTGAIVINEENCIGCRYCQWTCPYDAPKFDAEKRIIAKCHLCYQGLLQGRKPACAEACPTGALDYGDRSQNKAGTYFPWFPGNGLNPSIEFTGVQNKLPLRIIPEKIFGTEPPVPSEKLVPLDIEWSLVAFSFLTTLSVASLIASLVNGVFPNRILFLSITILAGIVSLFHPGRAWRAWRALTNIKTSPLSREIAIFITYVPVAILTVVLELPAFLIVSAFTGLVLLLLIDSVYINSDRRKLLVFHSGQTFLSALLIISFFTGSMMSFLFIASIKTMSSLNIFFHKEINGVNSGIRFLRSALLIITAGSMIHGTSISGNVINILFLTGELFDRIIYYIDFEPVNINKLIFKHIKEEKDEKKRG